MKQFSKLTRPTMRKLAVGGKLTEHGITFERLPTGDGVFTVNVMADGQRIHRVVGRESDGTTRTQAEEFVAKVKSDAKHDRLALPKGRKVALSFRDAAGKYLTKLEQEGGKDLVAKRQRLTLHLVPFFGDTPLSKIDSFGVERYKKQRLSEPTLRGGDRVSEKAKTGARKAASDDRKASPGSVNRELACLSHLLNKAVEWGWISARPAKIKRLQEDGGRIVYLTVPQMGRLVEYAKADDNPSVYPFIIVGLSTGMRASEILSIQRNNVDLERRVIFIPKAKAGAREQPITEDLAVFLREHMKNYAPGSPWLFPSPSSKSGHMVEIRKPYRRVVKAAGLDPDQIIRHTLRHSAITHLVQSGVDLVTVKRISGHKTLAMVERYAHANGAHIADAMDTLQKRLNLA
ncbi:tyrosine-type recombinase/integrase [Paraburkholderia sp. D1E]|uniref:tyrosine-type recombinase/integrase n=1 Tax=Paraburkholderia sp. D1E TaxID=3461398 RepID=UPI0040458945